MNTEENNKKLKALEAQLKQVSTYYIPPDKESTSVTAGVSNSVMVNWKKKRMEDLRKEIENLTLLNDQGVR